MSLFSAVEMAPRDPILGLNEQFNADSNPAKVNLGVGVYFDDNGKLPLLQCVQAAEKTMMDKPTARGYLPIDGIVAYDNAVKGLVFGADSEPVTSGRVATVQAIGGTFFATDFDGAVIPGLTMTLSATDTSGTVTRHLFNSSAGSFMGFVSSTALVSMTVDAAAPAFGDSFATVNDLSLGLAATAVPEPASALLMALGLAALAWPRRQQSPHG